MTLSEIKSTLKKLDNITFKLPNGNVVPRHFHLTELGKTTKHFLDCGGTLRTEEYANFQLWEADDYDHRLHPEKLLSIIDLSESILGLHNLEIEVECQAETIGKYGLTFDGQYFVLTTKKTNCLAKDRCDIVEKSPQKKSANLQKSTNDYCDPVLGCC